LKTSDLGVRGRPALSLRKGDRCWSNCVYVLGVGVFGLVLGAAALAGPTDGEAERGARIAQRCAGCHGDAVRTPVRSMRPEIPVLAGQNAVAISKQLLDFRSGARTHAQMTAIAKGIEDADVDAVAAYYASTPIARSALRQSAYRADPAVERLARFGDNRRSLPGCTACHSSTGSRFPEAPKLAGQSRDYMIGQLNAFASGQRTNDAAGKMRSIASKLTRQERARLAEYFGSLRSS